MEIPITSDLVHLDATLLRVSSWEPRAPLMGGSQDWDSQKSAGIGEISQRGLRPRGWCLVVLSVCETFSQQADAEIKA